jgi:hypothetical protein
MNRIYSFFFKIIDINVGQIRWQTLASTVFHLATLIRSALFFIFLFGISILVIASRIWTLYLSSVAQIPNAILAIAFINFPGRTFFAAKPYYNGV